MDIGEAGFEVLGFPTLPPTYFCDTTGRAYRKLCDLLSFEKIGAVHRAVKQV